MLNYHKSRNGSVKEIPYTVNRLRYEIAQPKKPFGSIRTAFMAVASEHFAPFAVRGFLFAEVRCPGRSCTKTTHTHTDLAI